jgi:hypothetical protein
MATYYSQDSGAWSTLANWDTNTGGGGTDPASVAAMEDNLFVIQAGHIIDYNLTATSTWTTGFQTITIQGHATTPGMLRCDSTTEAAGNYILPMKTGFSIVGTTGAAKGRILCNSDGVWANSNNCANTVNFIIKTLAGSSAVATIDATYLTCKLLCTDPTNTYVEIYGCPFVVTFANATNKFTIVSPTNTPAIPPNGTPITLDGTLPAELTAGTIYFVKAVSGATGELEATIGGGTIDITGDGSGTIYMHYGCFGPADQSTSVNISTGVITWNGVPPAANTVVRVKSSVTLPTGLTSYNFYYVRTISGNTCKLSLTNDDTGIVIPSAVGSGNISMYCGSTYTTSKVVNVIQDITADAVPWVTTTGFNRVTLVATQIDVYDQQRDVLATIAARYMVLTNLTVANIRACPLSRLYLSTRNVSVQSLSTSTSQPIISASVGGIFKCEVSNIYQPGTVATFYSYAFSACNNNTISGIVVGCNYGLNTSCNNTISGIFASGAYCLISSHNNTVSGTIAGYSNAINSNNNLMSGLIFGCANVLSNSANNTITGIICGGGYAAYNDVGSVCSGLMCAFGNLTRSTGVCKIILKNVPMIIPPIFSNRNSSNYVMRVACENLNQVNGSYKIYDNFGDIIKTACDGTGAAPSADPNGGHDYCIEASNLQTNLGIPAGSIYPNILAIIASNEHRIWLTAASHTITYKVQTNFAAGITAGNLILYCRYLDSTGTLVDVSNAPTIAVRGTAADWTQVLTVTIIPGRAGWADFRIDLQQYESGKVVYVWPNPTVS